MYVQVLYVHFPDEFVFLTSYLTLYNGGETLIDSWVLLAIEQAGVCGRNSPHRPITMVQTPNDGDMLSVFIYFASGFYQIFTC